MLRLLAAGRACAAGQRRLRRHVPADQQGAHAAAVDRGRPARPRRPRAATGRPTPRLVWLETPTNPLLRCFDIEAIAAHRPRARRARRASTTRSPRRSCSSRCRSAPTSWCTRPRSTSAATATWSAGSSHSTTTTLAQRLRFTQNAAGAVPAPFDCYLALRGVKTLAVRMERHCANARAVVDLLVGHPAVERVLYPQLPDHPGHAAAAKQMRDFGGMVSFTLQGGRDVGVAGGRRHRAVHARRVARRGREPHRAPRADDPRLGRRLTAGGARHLLRLSVGIETAADLVADLEQALDRTPEHGQQHSSGNRVQALDRIRVDDPTVLAAGVHRDELGARPARRTTCTRPAARSATARHRRSTWSAGPRRAAPAR